MSHAAEGSGDSADVEQQITFNVKASNDQKFVLTLPSATSIADLKTKLATAEYANIEADRIRLIYSGRVLKDGDTLATYKVVDGNTIHMVKGAQSNARQNPASSSANATPAVPPASQLATGTGNNPLAGLTGARYAGFHGLPSASTFGPDGGMGPPPGPDDMLRMLDDPNFAQMLNESMNNPAVIQILESSPQIANNPMLRNMIRNPEMRRMLFSPEMLRMQMQMQRQMGGDGAGGAFPMPGATDTTPGPPSGLPPHLQAAAPQMPSGSFPNFAMPPGGGAQAGNPFAALFGNPAAAAGTTPATSPPTTASAGGQGTPATGTDQNAANPFANLFGAQAGAGAGAGGPGDPFAMARTMMQDPAMMRSIFGGAAGAGVGGAEGADANSPFAALLNNPGNSWGQPAGPPDNRPPEERYESQLRQLNDMGFFEFDRNVQALRRSGGSVQGAIEFLLGGGGGA